MSYAFTGVFPPIDVGFTEGEDARFYAIELEDKTIRSEMEGGYETSRPRSTRKPLKTFKTGFSGISAVDYDILVEFWNVYQGSRQFTWTNKATGNSHTVRMTEPPSFTYVGIGATSMYDVEITIKEV